MQDFGNLILFTHEPGDFELATEAMLLRYCHAIGLDVGMLEVRIAAKNIALEHVTAIKEAIRIEGVPTNLQQLFNATNKKEASKIAKVIKITKRDLTNMIANCEQIGFKHSRKHMQFVPHDLQPSLTQREAFQQNGIGTLKTKEAQTFVRKIYETFKKRRYVSAHLFEKGDEWHLLYFDLREITEPIGINHYVYGPHIHYISHLMGHNTNKAKIWQAIENGENVRGSEHIKYYNSLSV